MTFVKSTVQATRLSVSSTVGASSAGTPLSFPAAGIDQAIYHATITTAAVDYLPLASQSGVQKILAFSNDSASTVTYSVTASGSDLIYAPNSSVGVATYAMQPQEALTLLNIATAKWSVII